MTVEAARPSAATGPAITRLGALAPLTEAQRRTLGAALAAQTRTAARREVRLDENTAGRALIVQTGWAARMRYFSDGRRQILNFVLPGELIARDEPVAGPATVAITDVVTCPAPDPESFGDPLREACAISAALGEFYLLRQIARLGRLNAYERLADWLLELSERLALAGLVKPDGFPLPLTQEAIADALGLTSVHVNRTLQAMRRDGVLDVRAGSVRFTNPAQLAREVDFQPAKIVAITQVSG